MTSLISSIRSSSIVTLMRFSAMPMAVTEATPSILSRRGRTDSSTKAEHSSALMPSTSTEATMIGIISGLTCTIMGEPMFSSSQKGFTRSIFSRISLAAAFISVP